MITESKIQKLINSIETIQNLEIVSSPNSDKLLEAIQVLKLIRANTLELKDPVRKIIAVWFQNTILNDKHSTLFLDDAYQHFIVYLELNTNQSIPIPSKRHFSLIFREILFPLITNGIVREKKNSKVEFLGIKIK